jgi:hypothetical protein
MSPAAALALLLKKLRREVDVGFLLVIFVVLDLLKVKNPGLIDLSKQ